MKTITLLLLLAIPLLTLQAQDDEKKASVLSIEAFDNLYNFEHYYIAGQPSLDAYKWLHEQGVKKVINLRSEWENDDYTASSFNEESVVKELGMEYHSVPVEGREGYSPENLSVMASLIEGNEPVLIHCGGAGRATNFFMAYLVKYKGYSLDKAVEIGQEMTFFMPLETLLDEEIHMTSEE